MVDFVLGGCPCSYVFRGGAVRFSYSLVAFGVVLFFSLLGFCPFGNKFLIIQKKKNVATPKDLYVMPIADMLVDSTANNELFSFMEGFSSYNQILIVVEDIPKFAFSCHGSIGTFAWLVILFGIKNASATYQRAMNSIFHYMLGHHYKT